MTTPLPNAHATRSWLELRMQPCLCTENQNQQGSTPVGDQFGMCWISSLARQQTHPTRTPSSLPVPAMTLKKRETAPGSTRTLFASHAPADEIVVSQKLKRPRDLKLKTSLRQMLDESDGVLASIRLSLQSRRRIT